MAKKLLVVGGAGALGRGVVSRFARESWATLSVGFTYVFLARFGGSTTGDNLEFLSRLQAE